jgi:trehalose/maltose hydrolase-like predicted phosphorylase
VALSISCLVARHQPELTALRVVLVPDRDMTLTFAQPSPSGETLSVATRQSGRTGQRQIVRWSAGKDVLVQEDRIDFAGTAPSPRAASGQFPVVFRAGEEVTLTRFCATAWASVEARATQRVERALAGSLGGWDAVLERHQAAWEELWAADLVIEGEPVEQQIARSWMFYLLQSVRAGSADSIPPMGLSDTAFAGHVFWDAETWMFPALLLQHPDLARSMLEYRFRTLPGAVANAKAEGKRGATFAWESASTGQEQTPAGLGTRHGRHVTGDIALAFWQYWLATGDRAWLAERAWPVLQATAEYWVSRVTPEPGGGYGIRQVATPDENAGLVDNSAWTNYIAGKNLEFATEAARILGRKADPRWNQIASGLKLPRDPQTNLILQSAGYEGSKIKQTDALLLIFPGQMPLPDSEREQLYEFYADKTIDVGPAMSDSIHAIVAAELGRGEDAYRYFQESYQPFLRPPFLYFSEKRTRDNLYFHTGAGGCLQSLLYGFGGLRVRDTDRPTAEHPLLPKAWQSLEIRRLRWRGRDWDLRLEKDQPPKLTPCGR